MGKDSLKNIIKKAMDKKDESEDLDLQMDSMVNQKKSYKNLDRHLKSFGILCISIAIVMLSLTSNTTVDTTHAAKIALKERVSTSLSIGTVLSSEDQNVGKKDYTITHQLNQDKTKIWVWDYAAEDGDYVQVLVNGSPVTEPFMIKNKPKEIEVPATGDIQIKGIRDGGGGITYAIHYEVNNTNYFNTAPEGKFNTYTLIRQ